MTETRFKPDSDGGPSVDNWNLLENNRASGYDRLICEFDLPHFDVRAGSPTTGERLFA